MQVFGYILGGIFITGLTVLTAWNIYKLVKSIKERQKMKKENISVKEKKGEY